MSLYTAIKELEKNYKEDQVKGMLTAYEHGTEMLKEDLRVKDSELRSAYTTIKYMRHALKERGVSDLEMDYIFQGLYYRQSNKAN